MSGPDFLAVMVDALDEPDQRPEALFVLWSYFAANSEGNKGMRWLGVSEEIHNELALQVHRQLRRIGLEGLAKIEHVDLAASLAQSIIVFIPAEDLLRAVGMASRLSALRTVRRYTFVKTPPALDVEAKARVDSEGCLGWGKRFLELSEQRNIVARDLHRAHILLEKAVELYTFLTESRKAAGASVYLAQVYWMEAGGLGEAAVEIVSRLMNDSVSTLTFDDANALQALYKEMVEAGALEDEE
jgi:hypothetical protein